MFSMTGYGHGTAVTESARITIDISAVNSRKGADLRFGLPRELLGLEAVLALKMNKSVHRGTYNVILNYDPGVEQKKHLLHLDTATAAQMAEELKAFARNNGLSNDIRVADLIALPGIIVEQPVVLSQAIRDCALNALEKALANLRAMQQKEGDALKKDLECRQRNIHEQLEMLSSKADKALVQHRKSLSERMKILGFEVGPDDERLAREAAYYAERSDINEEVVRLKSHLEQFAENLTVEPAGRALEFVCQEMSREINTISSKVASPELSALALSMKTEIGKVREQVQNVE